MTKINRDAAIPSITRQPQTNAGATSSTPPPAPGASGADRFQPGAVAVSAPGLAPTDETKMDIICPLMGALVKSGRVTLDSNGRMKTKDLASALYNNVGATRTLAAAAMLAAPMGNKPSDILRNVLGMSFNPLKLRSGMIKHPNDSMILEHGRFDEEKFQALVKHAEGGKMTIRSYANAIAATIPRDGTDDGLNLARAEAAVVLNMFGSVDAQTGERTVDVTTLRNLYQHQQLPPEGLMMSRPRTGLGDLKSTMARIASAMPMGSSAGDSAQGVRMSLGAETSGSSATIGVGKARCPHMGGAGVTPPPAGADKIAALHSKPD